MAKINLAMRLAVGVAVIVLNLCTVALTAGADTTQLLSSTEAAETDPTSTVSMEMTTSSTTVTWFKTVITAITISDVTETTTCQVGCFTDTDSFSFVPPPGCTSALTPLSTTPGTLSTDTGEDENDTTATSVNIIAESLSTIVDTNTSASTVVLASSTSTPSSIDFIFPSSSVTAASNGGGNVTTETPLASVSTHVIVITANSSISATQNGTVTSAANTSHTGGTAQAEQVNNTMMGVWLTLFFVVYMLA